MGHHAMHVFLHVCNAFHRPYSAVVAAPAAVVGGASIIHGRNPIHRVVAHVVHTHVCVVHVVGTLCGGGRGNWRKARPLLNCFTRSNDARRTGINI